MCHRCAHVGAPCVGATYACATCACTCASCVGAPRACARVGAPVCGGGLHVRALSISNRHLALWLCAACLAEGPRMLDRHLPTCDGPPMLCDGMLCDGLTPTVCEPAQPKAAKEHCPPVLHCPAPHTSPHSAGCCCEGAQKGQGRVGRLYPSSQNDGGTAAWVPGCAMECTPVEQA